MKVKAILRNLSILLIVVLIVQFAVFFVSPKQAFASPGKFKVSEHGSGETTGGFTWRGYAFTVSTEITVTALIGGGTEGTFTVGLYEAVSGGSMPTSLLASFAFTNNEREQVGNLSSNVTLSPGNTYVLAQGAAEDLTNNKHYLVSSLNASDLVNESPIINSWRPDDNMSLYWPEYGSANTIVNMAPEDFSSYKPAIGFQYLTESSTSSSEAEPAPWVRNVQMTCYQVWINEDNEFEFVFWWEYKNNNWVKIYDMAGIEVFSIDMKYGNAKFTADLPDGMYTVKTFHTDLETPIQEFVIGKP